MEILQLVRARGTQWRVVDCRAFDRCSLVTLSSARTSSSGSVRRLLTPFDEVEPIAPDVRPRRVPMRRWRRACRALLAADVPPGSLRCAARARIDLWPHQLEPALAMVHGQATRVLLADDVGLGKTIQAGLIAAELLARSAAERTLILTPAGLRDQWVIELAERFGLDAVRADARSLRDRAATLPLGQNPWTTTPLAVASLDYVKRPEVLPAVAACVWDIVIVDEAHIAAGDSGRRSAVETLAAHAAYVVLLTATPHSGDERAFEALCGIGSVTGGGPLAIFRRTRCAVRGDASRRIHLLHVAPSPHERRMFDALAAYQRAVAAEHGDRALALSVLDKRAFSSAWSLAQSVNRRVAALDGAAAADGAGWQLALTLAEAGELDADDEPPPWPEDLALSDIKRERRLLTSLSDAAQAAFRATESKVRALARLLRRAREPAIVFTEYRDTAARLAARLGTTLLLHGGLNRTERASVLNAFERAGCAVLVATDAAGQGLNLQRRCRLVVNLELPWNPMRLEQRIGRVDRIGQTRRVHAVHLIASQTREERILDRLRDRIASAHASIEAPDPLGQSIERSRPVDRPSVDRPALEAEALAEAARLATVRAMIAERDGDRLGELEQTRWWIGRSRRARTRIALGARALFIFRLTAENAASDIVAARTLAVAGRIPSIEGDIIPPAIPDSFVEDWTRAVARAEDTFWSARLDRARTLGEAVPTSNERLYQPALFDRRAERERGELESDRDRLRNALYGRLVGAARRSSISRSRCDLLLVLLP